MAPITNQDFDTWIVEVLKTDAEDSKIDFWTLCEFAGYNPRIIFRKVWENCRGSDENLKLLRMIIHFGLTRGFGRGKTIATLVEKTNSAEGKILVQSACQVFNIKVGQKKTMDMVTIDRIMGAFPSMTYQAWTSMLSRGQVQDQCGYNGPLPMNFRYPGAAGIMDEDEFATWRTELIKWNGAVQELWSRNRPDNQRKTDDETANFIDIQFHQSILSMDARDRFWAEEQNKIDAAAAAASAKGSLRDDETPEVSRSVNPKRASPSGRNVK